MNYRYKDLLNRLSEMQKSPYYATACQTLVKVEMAIVNLEKENVDLLAALKAMDEAYCNVSPVMTREDRIEGRKALTAARAAIKKAEGL